MPTAKVTSKGQVTIPAVVRQDLGLHAGSRVSFVRTNDGTYELRPHSRSIIALKGAVPRRERPVTLDEMDEAIRLGATDAIAQ